MKHTPGPWKVTWYPRSCTAEIETVEQENGKYRHLTNALPMCGGPDDERETITEDGVTRDNYSAESCANARLIAAAPEMYEELKRIHSDMHRIRGDAGLRFICDAAPCYTAKLIAKAEGRKA